MEGKLSVANFDPYLTLLSDLNPCLGSRPNHFGIMKFAGFPILIPAYTAQVSKNPLIRFSNMT
jgi:hypothetical protein